MYRLVLWGPGGARGARGSARLLRPHRIQRPRAPAFRSGPLLRVLERELSLRPPPQRARNSESAYITGLILFFVLAPVAGASDVWWLALAGAIAMASKYVLAIRKKHIFNPAAVSAVILSLLGSTAAIWWIGTPAMLPGALVLGLLVVRKIRRFDLFWSFIVAAVIASSIYDWSIGTAIPGALLQMVMSWPLVFFAAIMLTEPLTTPPARPMRLAYGALVGILFALPFHFGIVYASPALALVLGNIFSYAVSPKQKIFLRFASKTQLSANVYEFAFTQSGALAFRAGAVSRVDAAAPQARHARQPALFHHRLRSPGTGDKARRARERAVEQF